MKKILMQAQAKIDNVLEIIFSKDFYVRKQSEFRIYEDGKLKMRCPVLARSESGSSFIYTVKTDGLVYVPGHSYQVKTSENYFIDIDISFLALTKEFEQKYRYDGPLGAIYSKDKTVFRVFSPFATRIILKLMRDGEKEYKTYVMNRYETNGIHELEVEGDLDKARYLFLVEVFGDKKDVVDPYSFSVGRNSQYSYVIDPERILSIDTRRNMLPPSDDLTKSIIYECSVRDMTSKIDIRDKGTYLGFVREGLKTRKGLPEGIDYLASLGIDYLQIQPVLDFQTIDDDDPFSTYNWGYDPLFYFVPEGSYSRNSDDPYQRLLDLRTMIGKIHEKGMRVVLDVVYNHVYSASLSSFDALVPRYYFRHNNDMTLSNGSGCGNDLESRNYMVRRLIIDSLIHLLKFYDVDGFRFDLMGILDIDTMRMCFDKCKELREDVVFYGEGWDLWTNLPSDQKASQYNSYKMPFCAFFNDRFRDVVKGKTGESEISVRGYLTGDTNYRDGFKHVILGSSVALAFAPLFSSPTQSLNYVECHDNHALFDKLKSCLPGEDEKDILTRVKMITVALLTSCGIAFFHAGQEIAMSKKGNGNSYDAGDDINGFDYNLLDSRKDMYYFFREAIKFSKRIADLIGEEHTDLRTLISFEDLPHGALKVNYNLKDFALVIIYNPSKENFTYSFEDYSQLLFNETGDVEKEDIYVKLAIVNGISFSVYLSRRHER